jgi:hypothetical protein
MRIHTCICLVLFGLTLRATTVVSENGTPSGSVNGGIGLEASWTSSVAYTNVDITVPVGSGSVVDSGTDTFFLTNQIGPGTTTANEIARTTVTVPGGVDSVVTIFSGLTLPAGNYFLVLGGPFTPALFWTFSDSPTITAGPGVTFNNTGAASPNCGFCLYVPATVFDTSSQFPFIFGVSGTAAVVPEPSPAVLLWPGLFILIGMVLLRARMTDRVHGPGNASSCRYGAAANGLCASSRYRPPA